MMASREGMLDRGASTSCHDCSLCLVALGHGSRDLIARESEERKAKFLEEEYCTRVRNRLTIHRGPGEA